jgi:hypothetical protein
VEGSFGVRELSWADVLARRLRGHALIDPASPPLLEEVVGRVGGIHAQVMSAAEISIGVRVAGTTRRAIRRAVVDERRLAKTYGPRGTVHLLPAGDLPMFMGALHALSHEWVRAEESRIGLDAGRLAELVAAIGDSLRGRMLTREELGARVMERLGSWAAVPAIASFGGLAPRWQAGLGYAAYADQLCFGPNRGNRATFVHPADWMGGSPPGDSFDCVTEVLRRYLLAYGPATPDAFAQWIGISRTQAAAIFADRQLFLEAVQIEGWTGWMWQGAGQDASQDQESVRLLPYFDAYGVGAYPRERVFGPMGATRALSRGAAGPVPIVVVNGEVAGVWEHARSSRRVRVTVDLFEPPSSSLSALVKAEGLRLAAVLEEPVDLQFGSVAIRAHL